MRPTFSIIFFTVLSGAGFGILFLTGLSFLCADWVISLVVQTGHADGVPLMLARAQRGCAVALAIGAMLGAAGLACSAGHLGKPLRAWRAFSQWRSSWLSREGIVSLLTFVPAVTLFGWMLAGGDPRAPVASALGIVLACLCVATVFCTARIYSSLMPIRAWHNGYVVPGYLLLALYSGALWIPAIHSYPRVISMFAIPAFHVSIVNMLAIAPLCAGLKFAYWRWLDANRDAPGTGDATGLARLGTVRSFEAPHTEQNYLTHEMGFVLARKHASRLRAIALILILFAPLIAFLLSLPLDYLGAWIGLVAGMLGVFVERWLFFAEARHAVIAFYGR
jgi:DMSO reductase anchor subunit